MQRVRHFLATRLQRHAGTEQLRRDTGTHLERIWARFDSAEGRLEEGLTELAERISRQASVDAVMAWIEQATLAREPLISVVMPTRNRAEMLARSIPSVVAQTYANWELLVADDGSDDETEGAVAAFADERIRYLRLEHRGLSATRNRALDEAHGELVAYLDDDNTMHAGWLKAVAWGFEQRPEAEVLYGAFLVHETGPGSPEALPQLWLHPFDRELIAEQNVADMSAIAHRAGIEGARFDETLRHMADWDLLARLTTDREPFVLPAVACFYYTDRHDRLTGSPDEQRDAARVVAKARAMRGLG